MRNILSKVCQVSCALAFSTIVAAQTIPGLPGGNLPSDWNSPSNPANPANQNNPMSPYYEPGNKVRLSADPAIVREAKYLGGLNPKEGGLKIRNMGQIALHKAANGFESVAYFQRGREINDANPETSKYPICKIWIPRDEVTLFRDEELKAKLVNFEISSASAVIEFTRAELEARYPDSRHVFPGGFISCERLGNTNQMVGNLIDALEGVMDIEVLHVAE